MIRAGEDVVLRIPNEEVLQLEERLINIPALPALLADPRSVPSFNSTLVHLTLARGALH